MLQNSSCSLGLSPPSPLPLASLCSGVAGLFASALSLPNGGRLRRLPQESGTVGRCYVLCLSLSLSPHLISPLSLFFFTPSLPPSLSRSVCPSPYLSLPAGTAARTHIHKRMSEYTLTRTLSFSLSLSLVNTPAHRCKHTLRQSKSKQTAKREKEEREEQDR